MFYIGFYKGAPSDYIIKFKNGKASKKGKGISFFYSTRKTSIIKIPAQTLDSFFVFNEKSKSYQHVAIQGEVRFRIIDFDKISTLLDYSIFPETGVYNTNDFEKLSQHIVNSAQLAAKQSIKDMELEQVLASSTEISDFILDKLKKDNSIKDMGVEIIGIFITSISPTPETSKALEADYREMLLKKADQAIYSRRAAAVEQERKIKENEMNSQIEIERKKKELVDLEGNNTVKSAEYDTKALQMELDIYKNLGPKVLLAMGIKSLGENVSAIENLNITPELLTEILNLKGK